MGRGTYIYHERQLGALCGVHCVNNLLQGPRFGPGDLAEIGVRLDKKERRLLGVEEQDSSSCNFDGSADGGNFSIQVLSVALARAGLKLLRSDHPDAVAVGQDLASAASAFMVQRRGHWYALRAAGPCWWDLDSLLALPKPLDKTAIASRLCRLVSGGHSIFLVLGKDLPEALPPAGAGTSSEGDSNWHDAIALLSPGGCVQPCSDGASVCEAAELGEITGPCLESFTEDEVHAALALAGGSCALAADFLQKARESIASLISSPPQRLARALSAAVGAVLQARRSLPTAIARLVALLCAPARELLVAAAALVDCGELAHQLLTALAKKSKGFLWTEGLAQAATVAVDLLLALPGGSCGGGGGNADDLKPPPCPLDPMEKERSATPTRRPSSPGAVANETSQDSLEAIFDTATLDELMDSVADEGASAGQPIVSAAGLKAAGADCRQSANAFQPPARAAPQTHTAASSAAKRGGKNSSQERQHTDKPQAERKLTSTSPSSRSQRVQDAKGSNATVADGGAAETGATRTRPRRRSSSTQPRQYESSP